MNRTAALEAAMGEPDPSSLGAGERLRTRFSREEATWALRQAALRRAAAVKFERADLMLFTRDGLEQATRQAVARWRARRFVDAGVEEVWDLGCGIGADAMAFAEAGLRVVAVDADPETVEVARHNVALIDPRAEVRLGRAEEQQPPPGAAVFLDPARRTARGRTWNVADFTPPWEFVLGQLASEWFVCVKLGPGVPKELIPGGVQAVWVSESRDVVEASLWNRFPAGTAAVVLGGGPEPVIAERQDASGGLDVRPIGRYLIEPNGAVIRAGAFEAIAPGRDVWLLDPHTAYLSSDEPVDSPLATCFEVREVLDYDRKRLRRFVADNGIGTLEIKRRGLDVDPAALRRELKPKGRASATIVLARTVEGAKAIVVERPPAASAEVNVHGGRPRRS
ncbi:MAG: class I SAM-dependent methyltransferase [Arachnia sp.]